MPQPPTRKITLSDSQKMEIPAQEYPWITEHTWTYDLPNRQIYRIENGRAIFLFNELLKHSRADRQQMILSDAAVDAMFMGTQPYEKLLVLCPQFIKAGKDLDIQFPNPYEMIAMPLAAVVTEYFVWLRKGVTYVLQGGHGDEMSHFLDIGREDKHPYAMADLYPTLGKWMYGEWTGRFEEGSTCPLSYHDHCWAIVDEVIRSLFSKTNIIHGYDEIEAFFEARELQLEDLVNVIHLLLESYPTPAR